MLKKTIVLVVLASLLFLSTPGFAGLIKGNVAKGPIVRIDTFKNEITVSDARSRGEEVTFKVTPAVAGSFQKGQVVIIRADAGSNVAKSVKLVEKIK